MSRVRQASPDDAEALAGLRYEFRASMNEPVESAEEFGLRCSSWMRDRLAMESPWRCWVVETNDEIVGHVWLCLLEKIPNPAPELEQHAYITNVYVRPDARAAGLGASLMEAAMEYCHEQGVDSVILWPTERSRPLYARYGFHAPEDMMEALAGEGRDLH